MNTILYHDIDHPIGKSEWYTLEELKEFHSAHKKDYDLSPVFEQFVSDWERVGLRKESVYIYTEGENHYILDGVFSWESLIDSICNEYNYLDILDAIDEDTNISISDKDELKRYINYMFQ